jgi:hypothetical protein
MKNTTAHQNVHIDPVIPTTFIFRKATTAGVDATAEVEESRGWPTKKPLVRSSAVQHGRSPRASKLLALASNRPGEFSGGEITLLV